MECGEGLPARGPAVKRARAQLAAVGTGPPDLHEVPPRLGPPQPATALRVEQVDAGGRVRRVIAPSSACRSRSPLVRRALRTRTGSPSALTDRSSSAPTSPGTWFGTRRRCPGRARRQTVLRRTGTLLVNDTARGRGVLSNVASRGVPAAVVCAPRVTLDERERARPRVGRRVGELLELAVEEAVRRAVVDRDLVLDASRLECLLELADVLDRDARVGAAHQGEDRRLELVRALGRPRAGRRGPAPAARRSRPRPRARARRRPRATSCRPPKQNPTVKTDVAPSASRSQRDRGGGVGLHALARSSARRAACTRTRRRASRRRPCARSSRSRRRVAALGEAERELLVEAVEPADVGEDHDPGAARAVRRRGEGGEAVAVGAPRARGRRARRRRP